MTEQQNKKEVRKVSMRISGGSLPKGYSIILNVEMDFTGCTREELIGWSVGERKVSAQRWLRNKTPEFLEDLQTKGFRIHAREAGSQVKSREDKIKEIENMGINRQVAEFLVDNPDQMEKMVNKDNS